MTMKKNIVFFLKCMLAAAPVLMVVLYTAFCPFGYMDQEYPSWKYTKDFNKGRISREEDDEVIILGDSRAMADLVPRYMGDNVYNLAVGGATAIEMYYTLKQRIEEAGAPQSVVIMFAPFHYSYIDNFWTRSIYFHHFSFSEALTVWREGKEYVSPSVCDGEHGIFDIVSIYLDLPGSYMPALINSRFHGRYDENLEAYNNICYEKGHGLFGTEDGSSDRNYESNYTEFNTREDFKLLDLYIKRLLGLCEEYGIRTIVSQPPMNKASYERLNADYVSQYTKYIESMQNLYPDAVIDSQILCYPNEFFGDSSHLNEKGAQKFTEEFMARYEGRRIK